MTGWISIYRQILDCDIWDTDEPYDYRSAWIYLLLMANHKDKKILFDKKPMTILRGQHLTSIRKLAEHFHWSNDKTWRFLRTLEELEMINRDSDSRRTVITIVNYEVFQCDKDNCRTLTSTVVSTLAEQNNNINKKIKKEVYIKADESPEFITLTLNDGSEFSVTENMISEWQSLYPSVDVKQELRNMKGWVNSNPTKRKTRSGINRFITSWLAREQNRGSKNQPVKTNRFNDIPKTEYDFDSLEKVLGG